MMSKILKLSDKMLGYDQPSPHQAIWQMYSQMRRMDLLPRSGFGLCGCYPYPRPESEILPETDSMHTLATMLLMMLLGQFLPHLFTVTHQPPYTEQERMVAEARVYELVQLLAFHDVGEALSELGDQPDDGSQDRTVKDRLEAQSLKKLTTPMPSEVRRRLRTDFRQFQSPMDPDATEEWTPFYGEMIQLARLCDKADAVLGGILYELRGQKGDLMYKEANFKPLTRQDREYIDAAGNDSSLVAAWCAHFIAEYHNYFGFYDLISIIRAGVIETRGKWFPWWRRYCKELGIDDYQW